MPEETPGIRDFTYTGAKSFQEKIPDSIQTPTSANTGQTPTTGLTARKKALQQKKAWKLELFAGQSSPMTELSSPIPNSVRKAFKPPTIRSTNVLNSMQVTSGSKKVEAKDGTALQTPAKLMGSSQKENEPIVPVDKDELSVHTTNVDVESSVLDTVVEMSSECDTRQAISTPGSRAFVLEDLSSSAPGPCSNDAPGNSTGMIDRQCKSQSEIDSQDGRHGRERRKRTRGEIDSDRLVGDCTAEGSSKRRRSLRLSKKQR